MCAACPYKLCCYGLLNSQRAVDDLHFWWHRELSVPSLAMLMEYLHFLHVSHAFCPFGIR